MASPRVAGAAGSIRTYPAGHFDIYTDQLDFLKRHVPPSHAENDRYRYPFRKPRICL